MESRGKVNKPYFKIVRNLIGHTINSNAKVLKSLYVCANINGIDTFALDNGLDSSFINIIII